MWQITILLQDLMKKKLILLLSETLIGEIINKIKET